MSKDTRFKPGQSGNPKGRPPKPRRHNVSAFEIVLDKRLTATVGGRERELTVEEVLQQQTLKGALAGKRMAIRKVLKMIEKREAALAKKNKLPRSPVRIESQYEPDNANEALSILDIATPGPTHPKRWKVKAWATQAALSRPGRRKYAEREASIIYKATGNIWAFQILLGYSKIENTVRYLVVDFEDALTLAEKTEI